MALTKLKLPASADGYNANFDDNVVSARLDGPAGRYRPGLSGEPRLVTVIWRTDPSGYLYFKAFWRTRIARGCLPFLVDLVVDLATRTEHRATFVPGTLRLVEWTGHRYVLTAQLELTRVI